MAFSIPGFHSAVIGYNKHEVSEFIRRTESEIEILESKQRASAKTIESLKAENETLTMRAAALSSAQAAAKAAADQAAKDIDRITAENEQLRAQLSCSQAAQLQLEQTNRSLQESLDDLTAKYAAVAELQQELTSLREELHSSEAQRNAIPDALINAQRMRDIILAEANEKAGQLMEDAQKFADKTIKEAQNKAAALKLANSRIHEDGIRLKNKLAELCNQHLSMLAGFPKSPDSDPDDSKDTAE